MTASQTPRTADIMAEAESYDGIQAGIVSLLRVLSGPSYLTDPDDPVLSTGLDDPAIDRWGLFPTVNIAGPFAAKRWTATGHIRFL